jgi:hypothetical protein
VCSRPLASLAPTSTRSGTSQKLREVWMTARETREGFAGRCRARWHLRRIRMG